MAMTEFEEQSLALLTEIRDLLKSQSPDIDMPEDCQKHRCSYFMHYLAYGGPDLTHEGFHAAEEQGLRHMKECRATLDRICSVCTSYEQRLRA